MTTETLTLTEFLLARIAEDEAAILRGWDSDGRARVATMWTGDEPGYTTVASDHGDGHWVADGRPVEDARRVRVLFDPARVLAECEAKRRIVEFHRPSSDAPGPEWLPYCEGCWQEGGEDGAPLHPCRTIRFIAAIYADHPDYRADWQ